MTGPPTEDRQAVGHEAGRRAPRDRTGMLANSGWLEMPEPGASVDIIHIDTCGKSGLSESKHLPRGFANFIADESHLVEVLESCKPRAHHALFIASDSLGLRFEHQQYLALPRPSASDWGVVIMLENQ